MPKPGDGNLLMINELARKVIPPARLIGIDLGTKTIGLALSDVEQTIAGPLTTLRRGKFTIDAGRLLELIDTHRVGGLVVGLPLNMDGSHGPRVQATKAFVRNLASHIALPVILWDERLSTVAAERAMLEADLSRAKRAQRIDSAAASFILQGALDRIARLRRSDHPAFG